MKSTTDLYKQLLASGNTRKFNVKIGLTLADETELELTEEDIWADSFEINTASSGTSSFDIGSAIIGECKFSLNNFDERFSTYDFFNAQAVVWLKLIGDSTYYRMGFYTVDEPTFNGALIDIIMLDDMWKFDVPLSEVGLIFPLTAISAVSSICTYCGVTLNTQTFHGYNFTLPVEPAEEMNCREFLQYVAMIGCNFCVINSAGTLDIRWYDTSSITSDLDGGTFSTTTTPYSDGDTADGGNFTDYTSGDSYDGGSFVATGMDYFTRNFSTQLGTDEIEITGVKMTISDTEYTVGDTGYVLSLENPLVTTDTVSSVLNLIWDVLEGFKLRTFNISTLTDIAAEVGDRCAVMDLKGNIVYSFITSIDLGLSAQTVRCDAESVTRTLTKRYSNAQKAAVEIARKIVDETMTDYDTAVQLMNNLAVNSLGAYENYEDLSTGGRVYYLSNMPITKTNNVCSFETGSTVFKKSGDGFFVSTDGGTTWTNGYNANTGQLVVNALNAIGISAEWIKTGTMSADYIYGGMLRIGGEEDSAIYAIPSSTYVVVSGSITQDTTKSIKGNDFQQTGNYVISLTFNTMTDVRIKVYDTVLGRYVEEKRTTEGFINLETVFNIPTVDNTEYYRIEFKHYNNENYTYAVRAYGYVTKIDKNGILTTYLNAMGGSFKGHLEAISGNFGIMEIDATDPNNPRLIIEHDTDIFFYDEYENFTSSIKERHNFNPYVDGWSADGHVFINFSCDLEEGYADKKCVRVALIKKNGNTIVASEHMNLDEDGNPYGADPHDNSVFDMEIDKDWGKNTGEFYQIFYTIYKAGWNGSSAWIEAYEADGVAQIGTRIDKNEIYGRLRGELYGSAQVWDLIVDKWAYAIANESMTYNLDDSDDSETHTTTVYDGTFVGRDGFKFKHSSDYISGDCDSIQVHSSSSDATLEADKLTITDGSKTALLKKTSLQLGDSATFQLELSDNSIYKKNNGTVTSVLWDNGSDRRLKEDIKPIDSDLSKNLIDITEPVSFKYKHRDGKHYGMIAQDVREQLDNLGETDAELERSMGLSKEQTGMDDQRTIRYEEYIPHLINYVKELRAEIETLKEALHGYTDETR